jgi:predicted Zn-dependent protease
MINLSFMRKRAPADFASTSPAPRTGRPVKRERYNLSVLLGGVLLVAVALSMIACVTTGPGGDKSFVMISTGQEVSMGREMHEQIMSENKALADTSWQNYLARVGKSIVAVCDRKDLDYQFTVVESPQLNAFAAPGGYVYFYTGILQHMENEAELAAVMAHEISHVVARHGAKKLQTVMGISVVLQIALGNAGELTQQAVGVVLGLAINGYGRSMELEADRFGVAYMTAAGYNPNGAVTMFQKLAEMGGGGSRNAFEKLASTHPETQERIAKIKEQIGTMSGKPAELPVHEDRYMKMRAKLPPPPKDATGG